MLVFVYAAVIGAVVIEAVAPATIARLPGTDELAFLGVLVALAAVISLGVWRRWRWLFWLIVLAFLAGVLRLPATVVELHSVAPKRGPDWYLVLQAAVGVVQFVIGVLLIRGYRKAGTWGAF